MVTRWTPEVVANLTPEELQVWLDRVEEMTHEDMARLWRASSPGSTPYFIEDTPIWQAFEAKWNEFGGWNTTLSKKIGW